MKSVTITAAAEKSLGRHHPWVFSGALKKAEGGIQSGETVDILSAHGTWLACGAYSSRSQIRVRVWSFDHNDEISEQFFYDRLERALKVRQSILKPGTCSAYRLFNSESDGLPGVIVDRYGDFLVCQFLSAGAEQWRHEIVNQLHSLVQPMGIYERSDVDVRLKEGLKPRSGLLWGKYPPDLIEILQGPLRFWVDVYHGHKTGFYLDQRENHAILLEFSAGAEVLNCFSYTGGFGVWALKGGARHVTNVDTSLDALSLAQRNFDLNGLSKVRVENIADDVFHVLRRYRDSGRQFDLIILDPPKFVSSVRQMTSGSRGYKDINLLAMKLLSPGGILLTFSCSGLVEPSLFQKIVADASLDAGRDVKILRYLSQASDHSIGLNFPEGRYLKGLVCTVL